MIGKWKDPIKEPPLFEGEVEVAYKAPINGLQYMGVAIYKGKDKWYINGELIPDNNIVCWSPATTFYQG